LQQWQASKVRRKWLYQINVKAAEAAKIDTQGDFQRPTIDTQAFPNTSAD